MKDGVLEKLARDIEQGKIARFDPATVARWQEIVRGVEIDRENDVIYGDVGLEA